MQSKFEMFQSVVAARDIFQPELMGAWGLGKPGLVDGKPCVLKGTHGAIVEIYENLGEVEVGVEFFDDDGETIDVGFFPEAYVRPATPAELEERRQHFAVLFPDP